MPTLRDNPNSLRMRLTWQKRFRRSLFSILLDRLIVQNAKSKTIADSIRFVLDQSSMSPRIPFFHSREKLWTQVASEHLTGEWIGIELGVASGDSSKSIAKLPQFGLCRAWHGFDTFYGLPNPWGDLPKGAFSTGGVPPEINDGRYSWHIGDIADTINDLDTCDLQGKKKLILFDFDLYKPSKIAWDKLFGLLESGDIVYFDEAYESDESRLIREIGNSDLNLLMPIGFTIMASCFLVQKIAPKK
jgi:hypothetical protein